jgi:hypothetical protein
MAAVPINLTAEKGTDFSATLTLRDEYDQYINLTAYSVVAKYSSSYVNSTKYNFTVNITNPILGAIEIKLNSLQTSTLKLPRYVYDVVVTAPINLGGKKFRVVEGILEVSPGVS